MDISGITKRDERHSLLLWGECIVWDGECYPRRRVKQLYRECRRNTEQGVREAAKICTAPCKLIFDLLTLKEVSESCVTCATSVLILVFLSLSVLDINI